VGSRDEAEEAAGEIGYPVVLKPARGGGGRRVLLVEDEGMLPELDRPYLVQEFVEGTPVSVSTLSTGREAAVISTSRQILGSGFLNQGGFTYCGSIVPLGRPLDEGVLQQVEEITELFRVKGWSGVDLVLGRKPYFMEVNPRFQGTFDCVEMVHGINLVDAHIRACRGELVEVPQGKGCCVRMTLFAGERVIVRDTRPMTHDIPYQDVIIERGEPVTTVISSGVDQTTAISLAESRIRDIKRVMHKI